MPIHSTSSHVGTGALLLTCLLSILLTACAPFAAGSHRAGVRLLHSPTCHCRVRYPASWYFEPSHGDPSNPQLGLHSYDLGSAHHLAIPRRFADIGIDWQADPSGALFQGTVASALTGAKPRRLTVSGWPAVTYSQWTAPPGQGGILEQHVYFFVPWYRRDYDVWLRAANPPSQHVGDLQGTFQQVVYSFVIVRPGQVP